MLTKNALANIKAGPDDGLGEGQFIGYASVFGNIDSYGDVVMPGAFDADLAAWEAKGDPIPLLFGHNMSDPDFNLGHLLSATPDDIGLKVHAQLDLENPKSKQTYRLLKGRRINQMSFAYDILAAGWEVRPREGGKDGETEEFFALKELRIHEVSVVPLGANSETEILDVKALTHFAERARVIDLKAGRVLSAKNEGELRTAHDAIGKVLDALDSSNDEEKASGSGASQKTDESSEASSTPSVDTSALDALDLELSASE